MDLQTIAIRPLTAADLRAVERDLSPDHPSKHARRFERQQRGEGLYLIAWDGPRPIGHVFVEWESEPFGPPELALHTIPYFIDFYVLPNYRSLGVGTRLLHALERECVERGYRRLCCAVAANNVRAQVLYGRLGYRDSGIGLSHFAYNYVDEDGRERTYEEDRYYLVKPL
jgi:GNAT superfamily N-acetyltransferase